MIFIGFILISSMFFVFAFFAGSISHFYNLDSMGIILFVVLIFSIFTFKWSEFVQGLKSMFIFNKNTYKKNNAVANHYKALMFVSIAGGIVSTIQGLISHALSIRDLSEVALKIPISEALSYASFTIAYAIMFSFFLFYPVYLLNRENK